VDAAVPDLSSVFGPAWTIVAGYGNARPRVDFPRLVQLYLQGKLGAGKPPIVVQCMGQTIAVSADQNCRRVY